MDIRNIEKLIKLLEGSEISELEIKEGEVTIRLNRFNPKEPVHYISTAAAPSPMPTQAHSLPATAAAPVASAPAAAAVPAATAVESGHQLKSPMVGTVYSSPSPDAAPFAVIGQSVKVGDPLCIIEAMKMFNEIEADRAGKIKAILFKNGDPIEFDQPLFIIE